MKAATLLFLVVLSGTARCYRSPETPVDREGQKRAALAAIEMVLAERDTELLELFYYPDERRREAESRGLLRQLAVLRDRFGGISEVRPFRGVPDSHFVGISAGTVDYWARHPHATSFTFSVNFERQGPGWVFIDLTHWSASPRLKSIAYALPKEKDGSGRLMLEVMSDMRRLAADGR